VGILPPYLPIKAGVTLLMDDCDSVPLILLKM